MNDRQTESSMASPLARDELGKINAYWQAANHLSVGHIYLYNNPLLTKPLEISNIKPRLLGHWGSRQVPLARRTTEPHQVETLEIWMWS